MRTLFITLLAAFAASIASADVNINIWATSGPFGSTSSDVDSFADNVVLSAQNSGSTLGSGVEKVDPVTEADARDFVSTPDFTSWRADANPSGVFANENGNMLWFFVNISSDDGTEFTLDSLSWSLDSNDSNDWFDDSGTFSAYGDHLNGIAADGTRYESGNASTPVTTIEGITVGKGLSPSTTTGSEQDRIDTIVSSVNSEAPFEVTAEYFLIAESGQNFDDRSSVSVTNVPEPSMATLMLASLAFVITLTMKRN